MTDINAQTIIMMQEKILCKKDSKTFELIQRQTPDYDTVNKVDFSLNRSYYTK